MADQLIGLTATQVKAVYESGKLTVEQYASALLAHIKARDEIVKAWVYLDPELVLQQARQLDQVPKKERGPLHGIAIAIKDVIATKDMPTQHGSPLFTGSRTGVDAASVTVLRQAGALIFGKTTTTEFAATYIGTATTNPHDPRRTPGGSSSGSAAAVADFQVPLALGSQTGASVVRPASFTGIYGLKPTWNAVSVEGQKTYSINLDTLGFFARSVEDLELLSTVLGVYDGTSTTGPGSGSELLRSGSGSGSASGQLQRTIGVRGARIAFLRPDEWHLAEPATRKAMEQGALLLREAGAAVDSISLPPAFGRLLEWHRTVMLGDGRVAFRSAWRTDKSKLAASLVETVEKPPSRAEYVAAFDGLAALRPQWDALAQAYAAVVVPSVPGEAPLGLAWTGDMRPGAIWTALHAPVLNVPAAAFAGEHGLPVGLSLVAARFGDAALLDVARRVAAVWEPSASLGVK